MVGLAHYASIILSIIALKFDLSIIEHNDIDNKGKVTKVIYN